ncbi:hypothetical protein B4N84_12280, partial [Flavobacterium sp. IR1]
SDIERSFIIREKEHDEDHALFYVSYRGNRICPFVTVYASVEDVNARVQPVIVLLQELIASVYSNCAGSAGLYAGGELNCIHLVDYSVTSHVSRNKDTLPYLFRTP